MVNGLVVIPLGLATLIAVFVALVTYRRRPTPTPAVETTPRVCDAAVENPVEAGEDFPLPSPASGAPADDEYERHVADALAVANSHPAHRTWWCLTCHRIYVLTTAEAITDQQLHNHADDFTTWEKELHA